MKFVKLFGAKNELRLIHFARFFTPQKTALFLACFVLLGFFGNSYQFSLNLRLFFTLFSVFGLLCVFYANLARNNYKDSITDIFD